MNNQKIMIQIIEQLDQKISHLMEENLQLWSCFHEDTNNGLNQRTNILIKMFDQIEDQLTTLLNSNKEEYGVTSKNIGVLNNNLLNTWTHWEGDGFH